MLHQQQLDKARNAFETLIAAEGPERGLSQGALIHLRVCEQRLAYRAGGPKTVEGLSNVAVTLINDGHSDPALDHPNRALEQGPRCDDVIYALAVSDCRLGTFRSALKNLKQAVKLKAENRFLAQRDTDFEPLMGDSRFLSLVFPDQPAVRTSQAATDSTRCDWPPNPRS